jgi:electron transport complex protein RnfG
MKEMIQMVVVLTVLSVLSGGSLAFIQDKTAMNIENNKLQFVKGPAIKGILQNATNDPVADRFDLPSEGTNHTFFVGVLDDKTKAVVLESSGKGFGGDVGLVVGVDLKTDKILGVRVTTHSETPGVGSRAKSDPSFVSQFKGLALEEEFKVKADGGQIDALSGATITSRAVSAGVTEAGKIYKTLKPEIEEKVKSFK